MGKIGIAPHHQTLNLYYFSKYINFVIKLIQGRFEQLFVFFVIQFRKEKDEKKDKKSQGKKLIGSTLLVFLSHALHFI